MQLTLLRFLESGEYLRLGETQVRRSDVRIIAATNRPLEELLQSGKFRTDLFYRLNEFTIHVPPLRARKEEIKALCDRFIAECNERFGTKIKGLDAEALNKLEGHNWPGNVRELRAVIKRACVSAQGEIIRAIDLLLTAGADTGKVSPGAMLAGDLSLAALEKKHIEQVLAQTHWNKKESSNLLGISRPTLDRKIQDYGLIRPNGARDE